MKHLFIINPVSGGKRHDPNHTESMIKEAMADIGEPYEIYFTKAPKDACVKIEAEAKNCDDLRVYACGGDGTLNECVNGAALKENVCVTHVPCGTGNDFLKVFGDDAERFKDIKSLVHGDIHNIDLIKCNDMYCVNICSVGLDARVGADVHKYSTMPLLSGPISYVVSLIANLTKGTYSRFRIKTETLDEIGLYSLICACSGRYYGGGFNPMKDADIDDGVMSVLITSNVPLYKLALLLGKYASGRYYELKKYIRRVDTRFIEIQSADEFVVNVDGEAFYTDKVRFEMLPGTLKFIAPKGTKYWLDRVKNA